jgi:hypothetical protein
MASNRVPDEVLLWTTSGRKKRERPRIMCMKEICDAMTKEGLEKLEYVER